MKVTSFCLLLSIFCLIACEKEAITTSALLEKEQVTDHSKFPFDFDILKQACLLNGVNLTIAINNPKHYRYLWEINNQHGGHNIQPTACHCGTAATVRVTRISDGKSLHKSVGLPACQLLSKQTAKSVVTTTENSITL